MILNKFDVNDFVKEKFEMKCLFLYDGIYVQGKIARSKNFLTVYLYDLWKNQYLVLHESQLKNITLYTTVE